jgi:hypothetical protein
VTNYSYLPAVEISHCCGSQRLWHLPVATGSIYPCRCCCKTGSKNKHVHITILSCYRLCVYSEFPVPTTIKFFASMRTDQGFEAIRPGVTYKELSIGFLVKCKAIELKKGSIYK